MRATLLLVVLVLVAIVSLVDAHKSVRHIKPKTEEEREIHHGMKLEQAVIVEDDESFLARGGQEESEYDALDHSHKSHHKRWGPSYPDHTDLKNFHYRPPRFHEGEEIPHEIATEDYHLFGLSKSENF